MSCMAGPSGHEEKYNCYSDASSNGNQNIQTHLLQSFGPSPSPEIYNLSTTGMESMIGFHSKTQNGAVLWKPAAGQSSSGKEINHDFYNNHQHDFSSNKQHDLTELLDHVDEQSLRSCVFPCEGNERPSHGLSLSLNSSNPSSIGLQSFELRQQQSDDHHHDLIRFGPSSSRSVNVSNYQAPHGYSHIRNSRYLGPTQELLNEFCNLGTNQNSDNHMNSKMKGVQKNTTDNWDDENGIKKQSLYSLDLLELQRRKTKLLQMLDEVDRRYKHYCDQMKAVISSFESVAGNGAAKAYSNLASKAMSRHFRCLKDGILGQIKATKKAMGEKDSGVPGTMKGETPRLRLLDQTLRQQRAIQQMSTVEIHPWRPQRGLPERSVSVLRAWLFEHFLHPYPSDVDKHILARQTGLSRSQVSNWFINARVRLWKPMVEEMYLEELKENEQGMAGALNDAVLNHFDVEIDDHRNHDRSSSDHKPTHDQLVRIDSECLSSIINNNNSGKNDVGKNKTLQFEPPNPNFGGSYGAMEFDFSPYSGAAAAGGVSLTLGLHQHGGASGAGGVNLQFSSSASQSSLFYPRDQIEDCQTVQYSLLENESQTLPYRNLMGAQLLHDLAG